MYTSLVVCVFVPLGESPAVIGAVAGRPSSCSCRLYDCHLQAVKEFVKDTHKVGCYFDSQAAQSHIWTSRMDLTKTKMHGVQAEHSHPPRPTPSVILHHCVSHPGLATGILKYYSYLGTSHPVS